MDWVLGICGLEQEATDTVQRSRRIQIQYRRAGSYRYSIKEQEVAVSKNAVIFLRFLGSSRIDSSIRLFLAVGLAILAVELPVGVGGE